MVTAGFPAVAGMYDSRRPPSAEDHVRLASTVDASPTTSFREGPFAVAWTGAVAAQYVDDDWFVLVHGRLVVPGECRRGPSSFLDSARGDFVLAAYDRRRHSVTLARDHLGGRSLLWCENSGRLTFASDARQLVPLLPAQPGADIAALAHWLGLSGLPGDRTLHAGVHRLAPAHRLDLAEGAAPKLSRYWAPVYRRPERVTADEAAQRLRVTLTDAIDRRSDESTGVLLSGGLDSSSVAALATTLPEGSRPRRAYSAVFPGRPTVDEGALITKLGTALDLDVTRVVVRSGSVLSGALAYIQTWGLPPISPNLFFWFPLLERAHADGTTALLDGEGGDEILGLSPYLMADYLRRGRILGAFRLLNRIPGTTPQTRWSVKRPFVREYMVKGVAPAWLHERARQRRGGATYTPTWLRPELADAFLDSHEAGAWRRIDGPRWWAFFVDIFTRGMASGMLHDHVRHRGAMCGIEPRHPIFDVGVIELVLGLPPELSYDPRWSRPIVRETTAGILPDEVRLRTTKSNFDAIFHDCLAGPDLPLAREVLNPDRAAVTHFVEPAGLRELLDRVPEQSGRQRWALELWRLLTTELWLQHQAGTLDALTGRLAIPPADLELEPATARG